MNGWALVVVAAAVGAVAGELAAALRPRALAALARARAERTAARDERRNRAEWCPPGYSYSEDGAEVAIMGETLGRWRGSGDHPVILRVRFESGLEAFLPWCHGDALACPAPRATLREVAALPIFDRRNGESLWDWWERTGGHWL